MALKSSASLTRQQIVNLRIGGLTYAAIGRELNISGGFAKKLIREAGGAQSRKSIPGDITHVLLTTSQAAKLLNVHTNTVRRWADSGLLTTYRIGSRGDRRYLMADISRLLRI